MSTGSERAPQIGGRDWAFWIQALGLVAMWGAVGIVGYWFRWRVLGLREYGDVWWRMATVGVAVTTTFATYAGIMTYLFARLGATAQGDPPDVAVEAEEEAITESVMKGRGAGWWLAALVLAGFVAWSMRAWWGQLTQGLGVTGLGRPVFWGIYIINFEYFGTLAYGCILFAALLRLFRTEWRRPVTRVAEAIALLLILAAAWNIILDIGRPDRSWKFYVWGRGESPLFWDMSSITTFIFTAAIYMYVGLIPDLGLLRRRVTGWRRPLYHLLSFGWTGSREQVRVIHRTHIILSAVAIPVTVAVLSVVGWVFAVTIQPGWHSSIFAPYYVVGALVSAVAGLIAVLYLLRSSMAFGRFLLPAHFNLLGLVLLILSLVWTYFTGAELLTTFYGDEPSEMAVFHSKMVGAYAPLTWGMIALCVLVPVVLLARHRTPGKVLVAALSVLGGNWLERYITVVPTLVQPRLPVPTGHYVPDSVEWAMMLGTVSLAALMFMVFARFFPIISIWEVSEGRERGADAASRRIRAYFTPESSGREVA